MECQPRFFSTAHMDMLSEFYHLRNNPAFGLSPSRSKVTIGRDTSAKVLWVVEDKAGVCANLVMHDPQGVFQTWTLHVY